MSESEMFSILRRISHGAHEIQSSWTDGPGMAVIAGARLPQEDLEDNKGVVKKLHRLKLLVARALYLEDTDYLSDEAVEAMDMDRDVICRRPRREGR